MSESRPPRRRLRLALVVLAIALLVPVAAGAALFATFDADHYKPEILAAIRRATGRDVSVSGDIRLSLNPGLTLEANDATLGNFPNGSRPDMATLRRVEAEVAFWPLLRGHVEIQRLVLVHPDILLETDAEGRPNWWFRRHGRTSVPALAGEIAKHAHGSRFDIQSVHVTDGTLTFRNGRTGKTWVLGLPDFELTEPSPDALVTVAGKVSYGGDQIAVSGRFGPLSRLRRAAGASPWPVQISLAGRGLQVSAVGSFTDPRHGRGYTMRIEGKAGDLGRIAPLLPNPKLLPALHAVTFAVQVNDMGGPWPEPSAVAIHAGPSDLESTVPGLKLTALDLSAPGLGRPMQFAAQGSYFGVPLRMAARVGAPITMLHGIAGAPFPMDLTAEAAGATLFAKSDAATPGQAAGRTIEVTAKIPNLAALSPLMHRKLPPLRDIAVDAEFAPRGSNFVQGFVMKGLQLRMPQADITGGAVLVLGGDRPMLHATLSATRIDADGIAALARAPASPLPQAPAESSAQPTTPPLRAQPIAAKAPVGRPMLLPDEKLPVDKLRRHDAEMKMTIGELLLGGIEYRNVIAHFRLTNGHLHVAPLEGLAPTGPFDIYFDFNPNQPKIPVVFTAHSRGVALKPLLAILHLPDDDAGELEVDANLKSFGDTPRAIASSLTGHLGLALVNGAIDNRLLAAPMNALLHHARLPAAIGRKSGHSDVRCFAMRADADRGAVTLRAFVIDMAHFHASALGSLNLSNETMDLRSRPMLKFAGGGVAVPVRIDGPLSAPRAQPDPDAAAAAAALSRKLVLGSKTGAPPAADPTNCDVALALARGMPVAAPPTAAPPPPPPPPKHEKAKSSRHAHKHRHRRSR